MRVFTAFFISCLLAAAQGPPASGVGSIIEKLRSNPGELGLIGQLDKYWDDPRVIPALRDLFAEDRASRVVGQLANLSVPASQVVALTLLKNGVRDEIYFEELAGYVREAISADPPPNEYLVDSEGNERPDRGRDPDFGAWCAKRSLDVGSCLSVVLVYAMDLDFMIGAKDPRAVPLFRTL